MMNTEIYFIYKGQKTCIQGEIDLSMKDNFNIFINKLKLYNINLRFEFNHEVINKDITLKEFVAMNKIENNKIEIKVIEENEIEILSEEIICPECKQEARIMVTDDKLAFICNNNHIKEIPKNEFKISQMIPQSKTKYECNSNQIKRFCLTCKKSLSTFCEIDHKKHNNEHLIIYDSQKNFFCLKHNKCKNQFISYCKTCEKNLCSICCDSHRDHQLKNLNEIYYLKDKLILKQKDFLSILKNLEQAYEEFKKQLDSLKSTYEMNEIIIKNYNIENRNFTKLINYEEIYNKNFNLQEINKFLKNLSNIIKIDVNFQEININNFSNIIINDEIINEQNHEIKECSSIISFNKSQFLSISHTSLNIQRIVEKIENNIEVKNNIDTNENYQKSYENEEQKDEDISEDKVNNNTQSIESSNEINYEDNNSEDDNVLSNIKENEENTERIEEISDHGNEKNQRIIQNNNQIKLIYSIKDNQKTKKIFGKNFVKRNKDKCYIIYKEQKYNLTEYFDVPDDLKGDLEIFLEGIDKITDASEMFYDCLLLTKLEFISKWDTSHIIYMIKMFENCESLIPFPDISEWNLGNVISIQL